MAQTRPTKQVAAFLRKKRGDTLRYLRQKTGHHSIQPIPVRELPAERDLEDLGADL